MTDQLICFECNTAITERSRKNRMFCGPECRQSFNNRRMQRGAQLYDLFMAQRFERADAERQQVWSAMCRLGMRWRDEDIEERGGNQSWGDWRNFLAKNPWLRAAIGPVTKIGRGAER